MSCVGMRLDFKKLTILRSIPLIDAGAAINKIFKGIVIFI